MTIRPSSTPSRAFFEEADEVDLVGRARDGQQALRLIAELAPDVAVLDVRMPGVSGIEIARQLCSEGSSTMVILYTADADRSVVLEALDAGAQGFLLKEAPLADLIRAIEMVCGGGTYVDPALTGLLTKSSRSGAAAVADQAGARGAASACRRDAERAGGTRALDLAAHREDVRQEGDGQARGRHADTGCRQCATAVADRVAPSTRPSSECDRSERRMALRAQRPDAWCMEESIISTASAGIACVVADDDPETLGATVALLETEGIDVSATDSGIDALAALQARPATVVLVDARLSDLNGLDVARRVAEISRQKTQVILFTGDASPEFVSDALDAGASGVVRSSTLHRRTCSPRSPKSSAVGSTSTPSCATKCSRQADAERCCPR